jgi:hypothetical protein
MRRNSQNITDCAFPHLEMFARVLCGTFSLGRLPDLFRLSRRAAAAPAEAERKRRVRRRRLGRFVRLFRSWLVSIVM